VVNHLLVLGTCFIHGGHRVREPEYPILIALLHSRILTAGIPFVVFPTIFKMGTGVTDSSTISISRASATIILLLLVCSTAFLCQIHSKSVLQTNGLRKLLKDRDERAEIYRFTRGTTGHVTSFVAGYIQTRLVAWLSSELDLDPAENDAKPTERASNPGSVSITVSGPFNTVILLVSCILSFCLCFYLSDSIPFENSGPRIPPASGGYFVIPLSMEVAEICATCLHAHRYNRAPKVGEIVSRAILSGARFVHFILPSCVLVGWIVGSPHSAFLFDTFQVGILTIAVLLPMHVIQTRSDDW
jgi:Ca2+/H+ antiporter